MGSLGRGVFTKGNAPSNACESAVLSLSAGRTPCVGKCVTCPVIWGACHAELAECGCIYIYIVTDRKRWEWWRFVCSDSSSLSPLILGMKGVADHRVSPVFSTGVVLQNQGTRS